MCLSQLKLRAPKSFMYFDHFLELISTFAFYSPEELADSPVTDGLPFDKDSEAYRIGMTVFYQRDMIQILGDFILQKESPLYKPGDFRDKMGNAYTKPNFACLIKVISTMMQDQKMITLYPLSEISQQIVSSKALLKMLMDPENDIDGSLALMAKGNFKISKKIAKAQLATLSGYDTDKIEAQWKSLKAFLKIKDEFQYQRIEWIFGIADLTKILPNRNRMNDHGSYGIQPNKNIDEKVYTYRSYVSEIKSCLLGRIIENKDSNHTIVLFSLREIIELCIDDDAIFNFIYQSKPHTYQYARFTDWLIPYIDDRADHLSKQQYKSMFLDKQANKIIEIRELLPKFEEKVAAAEAAQEAAFKAREEGAYQGIDKTWMGYQHPEVIKHWTPQYIVGKVQEELEKVCVQKLEHISVFLQELSCEWMYSNPDGQFNLSTPHVGKSPKIWGNPIMYENEKMAQAVTSGTDAQIETRDWNEQKSVGPVILQLVFDDDSLTENVKVGVSLKVADNEKKNVIFPKTPITGELKKNYILTAYSFQKIDPSKEGWGDITMEVWVKDGSGRSASVGFDTPNVNVSSLMENQGTVSFDNNVDAFYNVGSYGAHVSYGEAADMYPQDGYEAEHRMENDEMARQIAARNGGEVLQGEDDWDQEDDGEYNDREWNDNENNNFEDFA